MTLIHTFGPLAASTPVLIAIARVDHRSKRIPDQLSLLALAVTAGTASLLAITSHATGDLIRGAAGALLLTSVLGTLHLVRPDGLGMGDVKLALTLGLLLGWTRATVLDTALMVAWCLMAASSLGLALVAMNVRREGSSARGATVPFGPALCVATAAVVVVGPNFLAG